MRHYGVNSKQLAMKKIHRFIGHYQLGQGMLRIDDANLAHQVRSVLKLTAGEVIILGDGTGLELQCRIVRYDHDAVFVESIAAGRNMNEPQRRITLYLAVLKADHFESAAARATEVGVTRIVPLVTVRTVKTGLRIDRVQRIVREAAELAGRGLVPEVAAPIALEDVWDGARENDVNYFFDPSGTAMSTPAKSIRTVGIFIGPEGGWDEKELDQAQRLGLPVVSLGPLVLRADTAVTVAAYLVANGRNL